MDRKHFWLAVGGLATIGLLASAPNNPAAAQQAEVCNPVVDASGDPVVSSSGGAVLHSGSAPCPRVAVVETPPPPVAEVAPAAGPEPIEERVFFEFDESEIEPQFVDDLNRVAEQLQADVRDEVYLVGHTDAIGTDQYNLALGERRAESVADFLTNRGVERDRLVLLSRGESEPIATNETPEGRAQNRRVLIRAGEPATS